MPVIEVTLPALHSGQQRVEDSLRRFNVLNCGRRWGKTDFGANKALECSLDGGVTWWVAPFFEITKRAWEKIEPLAKQIPGHNIRYADREIYFPGGGWMAFRSADNPANLRGPGVDRLILDECAYIKQSAWEAELRPTLSDRQGDAFFISTPCGRNWFYEIFRMGQSEDWDDWASWQLPTSDNPFIPAEDIENARLTLPDSYFRQEYLAEFVTFYGKVYQSFTPESDHVFHGEPDFSLYREYWGGIDFGFSNPTCVAIGGLDRDDRLDIIDGLYQTNLTTPLLVEQVKAYEERYGIRRWFCDPADPDAIAQLKGAGIAAVKAPRTRTSLERSSIKDGIIKVETRLHQGKLRIAASTTPPDFIDTLDRYRYPDEKDGREIKETPLKVDDHFPDALRYLVMGLDAMYGRAPRVRVAS